MNLIKMLSVVSTLSLLTTTALAQTAHKNKLFIQPLQKSIYSDESQESVSKKAKVLSALAAKGYSNIVATEAEADLVLSLESSTDKYETGVSTTVDAIITEKGLSQKISEGHAVTMQDEVTAGSEGNAGVFTSEANQIEMTLIDSLNHLKAADLK